DEAASGVFSRFAREERTGHPALWEMEKRSLRRSLRAWLSQDADARSRSGAAPWRVELAFGIGKDGVPPVEVDLPDGVRLLFRGKIDRVDFSADGRVLVYDYKSGSPDKYDKLDKDVTKRGTLLQLPVYALAARRAVEQQGHTARSVSASYWPVLRTVTLALKPRPDDFDENKAVARLKEVAGVIASGVEKGVFPARPGAPRSGRDGVPGSPFENCEYCAFDRVCAAPGRRARLWERKRGSDLVLAPYVRLAEAEG
ncbi:MAG: PD-(D/E)XK nuclease family protein, partial [Dehalococcoidia bacterium]|nr:PD-(D/E)XK nuclease family protein [Dehalococcoidia bacterium]